MSNHTFTGVFIPAKIWVAQDLIPQEKMMLAEIKALSEDKGWCFANNSHFAKWLGCGTQNISNYIKRFERDGMIEVTYTDKKTFAGRKMRVNLEWFHGLATPYTGNVTPYTGNVTEIQSKDTFKLNERGDAPAEISNTLEEEKNERGKVAPPPAEAADPTHMVTEIRPEAPGTRVVSPFVMPPRVDTVDEAEEIIMAWATADGRESVRKWYEEAARNCTANDVKEMVAKFAGVYLTISDEGKRQRMAQDPLQFFKYTFKLFLKNEKQYGARVMPGQSAQPSPTRVTVSTPQTQTRY